LPRNKRHGNVATIEPETMETDMTSATDTEEDYETNGDSAGAFELYQEPAPADYSPDRKTPGRQRRASFFDDKLRAPDVFEQGWQRVPVTSDDHKAYVLRELNRAKLFLNGTGRMEGEPEIGLDLDDKKDDAVYYKSRVAQKRTRQDRSGVSDLDENSQDEGLYSEDGDNDQ
jgi:hypothetical protein